MEQDKEKFHIFLDFDGVLNDFKTIPSITKLGGVFVKRNDNNVFNKESISALNYLIEILESKYDVDLVLSTNWRVNLSKAIDVLFSNGFKYKKEIKSLPFSLFDSKKRHLIDYLNKNKIDHNFLIIDDLKDIERQFIPKSRIVTNLYNGSLTMSTVLNYLDTYHKDLSDKISEMNTKF